MEVTEKYTNPIERAKIIQSQENKKLRLIHDTFDTEKTDSGTLIFNDVATPLPPEPPRVDWKVLWLAADTATKKIAVLAKRLGLE